MRRPLAALLLGAVSLAGLVPAVAAGAAELPKVPVHRPRKPVIKLACDVVRHDGAAGRLLLVVDPAAAGGAPTPSDPLPSSFRLGRVGRR